MSAFRHTSLTALLLCLALASACSSPQERPEEPLVPVEEAPAETKAIGEPGEMPITDAYVPVANLAEVDPSSLNARAPDMFLAKFTTTEGEFTAEFHREWAPNGVDRFYNLARNGYYTDIAAFRVIAGFMAQFGIHGDPAVNTVWREAKIQDDPTFRGASNTPGMITFAMAGPNTRTVQLFINFGNNQMLDSQGFTPIGKVREPGMDVVRSWYTGYGEGAPRGKGPDQAQTQSVGNDYLRDQFPSLSYIRSVEIVSE